eukprot:COSAG05_NODE_22436_length_265_cov_0.596386_1_plen_34_part_01
MDRRSVTCTGYTWPVEMNATAVGLWYCRNMRLLQ